MRRRARALLPVALFLATLVRGTAVAAGSFVNFETGQVRPLALSPDGTTLFAVNTPDDRLEIFGIDAGGGLTHTGSVSVGLEPVAVAARTDTDVWVVNHLSDSISIVSLVPTPHVVRTLLTCDEPRDIVFAGLGDTRAFVTTARRGQNCPVTPDLTTPGIGRALVQVFDAANLDPAGASLGGTPIANVVLFSDTPRALARSTDGATVYAAAFESGNESTSITEGAVCDGGAAASPCGALLQFPGGLPAPNVNVDGVPGPEVGLIVRKNPLTGAWEDAIGRDWSGAVRFDLPDLDVFAIDAAAATPDTTASFAHVGTVLFDVAVNPVSGKLYVSNTEARNEVRFEGPGLAFGSTTVQGHLHEARITVLDGTSVLPRHLNKHIDYDVRPAPPGTKERSLATPVGMAVSADGTTLYVAAFGSAKLGVFDTAALEADTFVPDAASHIPLSGGGPTGIVLDEARGRAYVLTRFDDAISIVDLAARAEVGHVPLFTPEPPVVRNGRSILYDAVFTSSNGEASCSSCHVFGDFDSLAWDLGNPDDAVLNNPLPFRIPPFGIPKDFHPLKGPMTTQSLRGLANHGSMHWRGDRTGGNDPGGSPFDEDAAFKKFNVAFPGLVGRDGEIPAADMQAFTDFILTVTYPPNPVRSLDGNLTNQQLNGRNLFFGPITDALFNCNGCHRLDPPSGFFGTDGFGTFEGETQMFKVAHLRNAYQKVGMFGMPGDATFQGPQVRGFGFLHDGSVDTVFRFLGAGVFTLTNAQQRQLEQFVLAFDSNLAPIVGQQITLAPASADAVATRIGLLIQRAVLGECDVVVKGVLNGEARGGFLTASGDFQLDRAADPPIPDATLRFQAQTAGQELTYTCVPPGSGRRIGVDRDEDGFFDRDELDAGTDPSDAASFPGAITPTGMRTKRLVLRDDDRFPINPNQSRLTFQSAKAGSAPSGVVVPTAGGQGDPTLAGAVLTVYRGDGGPGTVVLALPAARWTHAGAGATATYRYRDRDRVDGPITAVKLRAGHLDVRGKGTGLFQLDGAPQTSVAVRLRLGTELELCALAPAAAPAAANDTTARFVGARDTAAPATCPPIPPPGG
jgi:DNA-binding beta-propeller fold protein YncE